MESQKKQKIDPRRCRLLSALLQGPVSREHADTLAPASNSPQYIMELREAGIEIICLRRCFVDAEGFKRCPGTYHLTPEGREAARAWLRGDAA
ncbi:MAG: hypothetical protein IT466_01685 [Moraxellaceae bacterium]|nr:hypothetical protein [Moraxellaceae bacterium]